MAMQIASYSNATDRVVSPLLAVAVVGVVDLVEEEVVGALRVERPGFLHVESAATVEDDGSKSQLKNGRVSGSESKFIMDATLT